MKTHSQLLAMLCLMLLLSSASVWAATITITTPVSDGPDKYTTCGPVRVEATATFGDAEGPGDTPVLNVTGPNGWVGNFGMQLSAVPYTYFGYIDSTLGLRDGTNTLTVSIPVMVNRNPAGTATSAPVTLSVRNGWQVMTDTAKAKTYAKVFAPAEGATVRLNQNFTVSSDHRITWQRFERCGTYRIDYRYSQATTWSPVFGNPDYTYRYGDSWVELPQDTVEHDVQGNIAETYIMIGVYGQWTAEASSYFSPGRGYGSDGRTNSVAHSDPRNFTTAP